MGFNWRVSAGAAGAAFILSLIAGAFGGVPFGSLIGRALVGAVVFGAGAVAVSAVIGRYLPDLKQAGASGPIGERSPAGSRVDIVVDDALNEDGEPSGLSVQDDEDDEIGDLEAGDDDDEAGGEVAPASSGQEGPVEALEELDEAEAATLEGLPDIEGLSEGFPGVSGASDVAGGAHRSGEDPDLMARAIRTVLKREE